MSKQQGRMNRLLVIFVLAGIFILLGILLLIKEGIDSSRQREETLVAKKSELKKEHILGSEAKLPQIEDIVEIEDQSEKATQKELTEQGEKPPQQVKLKDLPLEKKSPEEEAVEQEVLDEGESTLEIYPSHEELEDLKKRGLIIY